MIIVVPASGSIGASAKVVDFMLATSSICCRVRSSASRGRLKAARKNLLLLISLKLTEVKLILGRKETELLLLLGFQLIDVDGLEVHKELLKETHGASRILVLVLG